MRKVLVCLVCVLLPLASVTVTAGAQQGNPIVGYLFTVTDARIPNGIRWVLMTPAEKQAYVGGFVIGSAAGVCWAEAGLLVMDQYGTERVSPMVKELIKGLISWTWLALPVELYVTELDNLYADPANRTIRVPEALYLVDDRLHGRSSDPAQYRRME